eukprot:1112644_1
MTQKQSLRVLENIPPAPINKVHLPLDIYYEITQVIVGFPLTYDAWKAGQISKSQMEQYAKQTFSDDFHCTYKGLITKEFIGYNDFCNNWLFSQEIKFQRVNYLCHVAQPLIILDYNKDKKEVIG